MTTAFEKLKEKLKEDKNVKLRLKANYMDAKELIATAGPVARFNLQRNDRFGKRGSKKITDNAKEALETFKSAYNNLGRQLILSDITLIAEIISTHSHKFSDYHKVNKTKGNRGRRMALQMLNQIHREILDCFYETSAVYLKLEGAITEAVYITERLEGLKIKEPTDYTKVETDPLKELYRHAKQLNRAKASEFEDLYASVKDMGRRLTTMENNIGDQKIFLQNYWECWADIGKAIQDYTRALELAELFVVKLNIVDKTGYGLGTDPISDGRKKLTTLLDSIYVKLDADRTTLGYPDRTPSQQALFDAAKIKASGDLAQQKESAEYYTTTVTDMSVNFPPEWKTKYPGIY